MYIKLVRLSKDNPIKHKIKAYFNTCSIRQKITDGLGVIVTP